MGVLPLFSSAAAVPATSTASIILSSSPVTLCGSPPTTFAPSPECTVVGAECTSCWSAAPTERGHGSRGRWEEEEGGEKGQVRLGDGDAAVTCCPGGYTCSNHVNGPTCIEVIVETTISTTTEMASSEGEMRTTLSDTTATETTLLARMTQDRHHYQRRVATVTARNANPSDAAAKAAAQPTSFKSEVDEQTLVLDTAAASSHYDKVTMDTSVPSSVAGGGGGISQDGGSDEDEGDSPGGAQKTASPSSSSSSSSENGGFDGTSDDDDEDEEEEEEEGGNRSSSMPAGAMIGITVGAGLLLMAVFLSGCFLWRRKQRMRRQERDARASAMMMKLDDMYQAGRGNVEREGGSGMGRERERVMEKPQPPVPAVSRAGAAIGGGAGGEYRGLDRPLPDTPMDGTWRPPRMI